MSSDEGHHGADERAREISSQAAEIGALRALLFFPFVVIPRLLRDVLGLAARSAARGIAGRIEARKRSERPPRPTSLGFTLIAVPVAVALLGLVYEPDLSLRDRVNAVGLLSLTLATVAVSPELLGLSALRRIDDWWLNSDLPAYQVAFARHLRSLNRMLLKVTAAASVILFTLCAVMAAIAAWGVWEREVRVTHYALLPLAYATGTALLALVASFAGRILLGRVDDVQAELFTAQDIEQALDDEKVREARLRTAAALFAAGTALSFVATVFLR